MWDESSTTLTGLAEILEAFIERWDDWNGVDAPRMHTLLPDVGETRRVALIELIKVDLEYRWVKHNLPLRIEDYLREFPELNAEAPPVDLLYEEFHVRRESGLNVDPHEFLQRFPQQASELGKLLGITASHNSTSLGRGLKARRLPEFHPGERIDEFDLLAFLGRGAFAQVFLARQRTMQRLVALKISADYGTEPQTLAQLDHDHIVRVYDLRPLPAHQVQLLYMQYLAGGTLQSVVETLKQTPATERTGRVLLRSIDRSLDDRGESAVDSPTRRQFAASSWPETVATLGSKLAAALDYAHSRGVLHRDVKPANVLLTADAVPKLADFNISFSSEVVGATPEAFFGGSLGYMSPEQLEAFSPAHERKPDSLDGRSDLYSLAIVLWELLTGQRPFSDVAFQGDWSRAITTMLEARRAGLSEAAIATLPAGCPPGILRVLHRALAPDPDDRWQTGAELSRQLSLCIRPEVETLLYPPKKSLRVRLRPWAVLFAVVAATIPNVFATVFNVLYNFDNIIRQVPSFQAIFNRLIIGVNLVAYPLGLGILGWLTWTVLRAARSPDRASISAERLAELRQRALKLGHLAAVIGVVEWALSGMTFPVIIHLMAGISPPYLHFLASLVLCGLIAAAYPFFVITLFSVRVLYPALRPAESGCNEDTPANLAVSRMAWWYLLLAAAVPLLGVATLAVGMAVGDSTDRSKAIALSVLGVGGFLGLVLLFPVFRLLQRDLATLRKVGSPTNEARDGERF